jgi:HSP20 family protein
MTIVKHNRPYINNLFDDFFGTFGNEWNALSHPATNIHETTDGFHVELSVPGLTKEDLKVNVENGLLSISYNKQEVAEQKEYKTIRREFASKSFKRTFSLDEKINADGVQAKYENGILQVYLPKKDVVKMPSKEITIS